MTTLVYGPYPPAPGHEAAEVLAVVKDLVTAGEEVVVVSPTPSAAHHHLDVGGPSGALALLRLAGDVERAVVRLDAAGLQAASDAARLRPPRLLLGRALRRMGDVELRLDRVPPDPSRGWLATVVGAAARIVVGSEEEREALVRGGVPASRVRLVDEVPAVRSARRLSALPAWSGTTREALQRDLRRRAAAARSHRDAVGVVGQAAATTKLREMGPLALTPIQSNKPGVRAVKVLIRRLIAWQLDPIIQQLNRLHRATIAAVEQLDVQGSASPTSASAAERNERSEA